MIYKSNILGRVVHVARIPAQPSQPTHVRPATTRSDNSGNRMRVPNSLTRQHVGRLSVFRFKTYDTRPKLRPLSFPANYYEFQTKFGKILSRFVEIWSRSFEIRWDFAVFRQNLGQILNDPIGSGQILALMINPRPTRINPKPTRPEPKNLTRSSSRFWVKFSPTRLIRVESELGTNLTCGQP